MKLILVLFAVIGLGCAAPATQPKALQDDLNEFLALIPVDEIVAIVQNHANTDPDVQQIITYLQGPEWAALVAEVAANPDYQALKEELMAAGIDIDALVASLHDLINGIVVPSKTARPSTRTLQAMLDEIMAAIPLADLIVLLNDKLTNSPEFIAFWERLTSEQTYQLVETVRALPEVQRLAAVLLEMGIDATAILNTVYEFLGWPPAKSTRALQDDLDEFLALIPVDEIVAIIQNYANTDPDVQQIITYLQGPEWAALIAEVAANPDYQALKEELLAAGIDIDALVASIHDLINGIVVPSKTARPGTRTVQAMLDEIMAAIPLADLIVLLNDKLTNSPEFIAFWERLTSEQTFQLVETVRALPEVQRLAAVLLEMGIDATAILNTVYEFLGWPPAKSTRALEDDLNEFLALIPVDEIVAIIQNYANTDPDVQQIITYLQGPEWAALIAEVAANPEYQALKEELLAAGIDIDGLVASLHDLINGIVVPSKTARPATRTVQAMLDEIMAAIPLADLIVLLNDKLTNSPEFIAFWERLTSEQTYQLVETVRALPEVQRLAAVLLEMGYDATAVLNTIYEFLGWPPAKSTRALQDDLDEFLALIPVDQIVAIIQNYANTDPDVQQIITYLQGPEWAALIAEVAANPEYQALKEELLAAGIDIDGLVASLHDLINGIVVPSKTARPSTRTVQAMLDEIMAAIPLADLIVLLNDKLTNSPEFIAFWERLTSEQTYQLVETVRALPEVQRLAAVLLEMGYDATAVLNTIYEFLGWPPAKSTRALQDDLDEFLALIPVDQIVAIIQNYANTDPDVQQIITYLQGPEWAALIAEVAANPDYQALKEELLAAGIDIDALVASIHDLINGIVVPSKTARPGTRTVQAMLDEIMAAIPLADLIVLLNDKLTNSPEFIAFWERLTSEQTFQLVETVRALPEVQRLAAVLLEMGIDATAILNTVYEFLGWPPAKSTKALEDDLNEFLALIPVDEIVAIIQNYANTDPDVQQIITYLQGPEWAALIAEVAANPEYQALKGELIAAGIDIDAIIASIHGLIAGIVVPSKIARPATRTVQAMLDEIMAAIPLADLIVLLNDKLTNSPEFIAFWERLTSEETHQLVEAVRALPEVQRLAAVLLEMGIDATAILTTIYDFLGWTIRFHLRG